MRTVFKDSAKIQRKYYHSHREERRAYERKYREENREKYLENLKKSRIKNDRWHVDYRAKRRLAVIKYYSNGKMCCACCSESKLEFLAIDHINGGGNKQRKESKVSNLAQWILKNNFPEGFQILCHNCNFAKGVYKICPHKLYAE